MASGDKFCWSCGSSLFANDKFCEKCGIRLADVTGQEKVSGKTNLFFKIGLIIGSLLFPPIGLVAGLKYLFTKHQRRFGTLLLVLGTVSVIGFTSNSESSSDAGSEGLIASYDCEKLKPKILEGSKERGTPFSAVILKINNDVKEIERTESKFVCEGTARTDRNTIVNIKYHMEEDGDGDVFYGAKVEKSSVAVVPTPTVAPTPTPLPKVFSMDQADGMLLTQDYFPEGWSITRSKTSISGIHTEFLSVKKIEVKMRLYATEEHARAAYYQRRKQAQEALQRKGVTDTEIENVGGSWMFVWMPSGNPAYQTEKWQVEGLYRNVTIQVFHEGSIGAAKKNFAVAIANKQVEKLKSMKPTGTSESMADESKSSSQILFNAGGEIFKIGVNGLNKVNLTQSIKVAELLQLPKAGSNYLPIESCPLWSPDRTKIAFRSDYSLYYQDKSEGMSEIGGLVIREIDFFRSSEKEDLTLEDVIFSPITGLPTGQSGVCPSSWSPDGTQILFAGGSNWDIYVLNLDGYEVTNLTNTEAHETEPQFSPDGTQILFTRGYGAPSYQEQIFVMNSDGTNVTQLTESRPLESYLSKLEIALLHEVAWGRETDWASMPRWSPDGQKIVFWLHRVAGKLPLPVLPSSVESMPTGLYLMEPDGSNMTFFLRGSSSDICTRKVDSYGSTYALGFNDVAWSPDGRRIAYTPKTCESGLSGQIYAIDIDGTNKVVIVDEVAKIVGIDWSSEPE